MNSAIRWRIMVLQAFMVIVFAGGAGFAFSLGTFTTNQIKDELTAQQIYFPGEDQIKTGGALDPAVFPQEIRDQAGNQVTDGNQARIYANDFINIHLQNIAGGLTYASMGSKISQLNAQLAQTPKESPQYADLQKQIATANGQRDTLFKGETLRGNLLNAYGWWTVGTYTVYAAFGLLLAALGVLGALVFEVFVGYRKTAEVTVPKTTAAAKA
ncbi:MAG TPA: hypothetical protein VJR46_11525 [Candidatus Dormibacteraeota bacterium]|nr:hypothetical protein [Candidatus Dormibacteraeota bacterium]